MEITSTFLTSLCPEKVSGKSGVSNLEKTNATQLFSFSEESISETEIGTVKKVKGIDGKKYDAIEKIYTETIDGVEWNVVEQTYIDKDENEVKITTKTRRLVKNYDGEDVEFTLTKEIKEICNLNSTHIEKITTDKEETKYYVKTNTTVEKKEIVGSRTHTNVERSAGIETVDVCKMPREIVQLLLRTSTTIGNID